MGNDSKAEKSPSLSKKSDTWKPIEKTQPNNENLTATNDFLNIGERMPKAKTEKRSFGVIDEDEEMRSIRDDSSSLEAIDEGIDDDLPNEEQAEEKLYTVQLFPYRLGDIFERAEKYARNHLFPLLSEQISNIFSVEKPNDSKNNAISIVSKSPSKSTRKFEENNDLVMSASTYVSQKSEDMTMNNNLNTVQTLQKLDKSQLADNLRPQPPIEKLLNRNDDDIEMESVKIDLPTYKPPIIESDKIFIPIDRGSLIT